MPNTNDTSIHRSATAVACAAIFVLLGSSGYEVQPGDTLAGIAAEQGATISELIELNDLSNPDLIRVGQVLALPGGASGATHTVAPGETLARIASAYGIRVSDLAAANDLPNPDLLRIGQLLTIPGSTPADEPATAAPAIEPTTHVVAAGDTLASIARRYGTTVQAVASANGITNASQIFAGTQLTIRDADDAATTTPIGRQPSSSSTHVVRAGDTLASIARQFDTTIDSLMATNGLDDADVILVGQELEVPAAGWVCPVPGGRYFNDWGFPRSGGRFHQGNDLFAPRGTEVLAPVSGHVELKSGVVGGLQFWLTGDDGNTYIGTHLDRFAQAGDVTAGTVVGYVGTSGNAVGSDPHLHFEILVGGSPVNPYPTLQANGC